MSFDYQVLIRSFIIIHLYQVAFWAWIWIIKMLIKKNADILIKKHQYDEKVKPFEIIPFRS